MASGEAQLIETPRYNQEPDRRESNAEAKGVHVVSFASLGQSPNAMRRSDTPGRANYTPTGIGESFAEYKVAGDGLYVVDCPLGWPGRLVLNRGLPFEIYPGMRIPERYSRIRLVELPGATTTPNVASQSPVVLAVGPGAHLFSKPGLRRHFWLPVQLGISIAELAAGAPGLTSNPMYIAGYDYWMLTVASSVAAIITINTTEATYARPFEKEGNELPLIISYNNWVLMPGGHQSFLSGGIQRHHEGQSPTGIAGAQFGPIGLNSLPLDAFHEMAETVSVNLQHSTGVSRTISMHGWAALRVRD